MANLNESLQDLMTLDGALCAAAVDYNSGMLLGSIGSGVDLDCRATSKKEEVRAKMKTMKSLGLNDSIEDILITLGKQYHILRPAEKINGIFIYYVLDSSRANLALARRKIADVESKMEM